MPLPAETSFGVDGESRRTKKSWRDGKLCCSQQMWSLDSAKAAAPSDDGDAAGSGEGTHVLPAVSGQAATKKV